MEARASHIPGLHSSKQATHPVPCIYSLSVVFYITAGQRNRVSLSVQLPAGQIHPPNTEKPPVTSDHNTQIIGTFGHEEF